MPRRAAIIAACALLTACATRPPAEPPPERRATLPPHQITIRTSPPGGVVDWNGDVLGAAPVTISLPPRFASFDSFPRWPENGAALQFFRARWPDGSWNTETFSSSEKLPSEIGIVSPSRIPDIDLEWGKQASSKRYPRKLPANR